MLPEDSTDNSKDPTASTETTGDPPKTNVIYKSEAEQLYDSVKDWKEDREFAGVFYSESLNLLWCPNHKICSNRGGMIKHFNSKHKQMKTITAPPTSLQTQIQTAEQPPSITVIATPEQMILEDHNREIAEAAGMLAKDYEMRAEYEMLHQQDRIPYHWSFYDWIKLGAILTWNEKWKINLTLNQDVALLDEKQRNWLKLTLAENAQKRKAETEEIIE